MRVELSVEPAGQWVELRDRITHAEDKEIRRARRRAQESNDDTWEDLTVALRIMIRAGHVLDVEGEAIPLPAPDLATVDRFPKDVVDEIMGLVLRFYVKATAPNPPTPPSSEGSSSD